MKLKTPTFEQIARLVANSERNRSVQLIDNSTQPPKLVGKGFYWTTPGGKLIHYPNAYRWHKIYHPSTLRVEVGANWKPLIPKGMQLKIEGGYLVLVRDSDGMDLHFFGSQMLRKNFRGWARKEMARSWKNRQIKLKEFKNFDKIKDKTYINFEDARRAGNCVAGILGWAERKLSLKKEEILTAPWLIQVPAKLAIRLDPGNECVRKSVVKAHQRETMVSI
jgi:hypothetical protein